MSLLWDGECGDVGTFLALLARVRFPFEQVLSVASAGKFPVLGQNVGQTEELRVGLLQVKLTLRNSCHKIIFKACCFGRSNVIAIKHRSQVGEILSVLIGQRSNPAMFTTNGFSF